MADQADRIAIITDSTSDLSPEHREQYGITVVPLYVVWGSEELRDGVDIDKEGFYSRLPKDPIHPKTSQPSPADFVQAIQATGAQQVLILTIASALSGTLNSAQQAANQVSAEVHAVDSFSTSMGLGWQVLAAARAREEGADIEGMIAAAQRVRENLSVLFAVDTLEYLHRGGRIGGAAKLLGTALQLKPLLAVDPITGRIDAVERTRTRKKALRRIVEASVEGLNGSQRGLRMSVLHAVAEEDARAIYDELKAQYRPEEITMNELTPILGTHAGPGIVGLVVVR
jgi:DegV family protein with EDD domain